MFHFLPVIGRKSAHLAAGFKHDLVCVDLGLDVPLRNEFGRLLNYWALLKLKLLLHGFHAE